MDYPRFGSYRHVAGYLSRLSGRNGNKCKNTRDLSAESYKERNEAISEEIIMKREYNFSKAVRGKFYRKGVDLRLPIYLDPQLRSKLERLARKKGRDVSEMVNQLLRKDVAVFEELM